MKTIMPLDILVPVVDLTDVPESEYPDKDDITLMEQAFDAMEPGDARSFTLTKVRIGGITVGNYQSRITSKFIYEGDLYVGTDLGVMNVTQFIRDIREAVENGHAGS